MERGLNSIKIKEEIEDSISDDSLFNITSWGADLSFRELISMYDENELVKPELQRKYVWDKKMASRFIESILLGLPVPSVFFAQARGQKLIVDGYQRIMTVYDYVRGIWSEDNKSFKLTNSIAINSKWRNKSFSELDIEDQRRIRSTTIHAIIFEQKKPEDNDSSLYQIFERINTGGKNLTPQEIRNCIYQGTLNSLLIELNENSTWRFLLNIKESDSRMGDIELILRFFALKTDKILKSEAKQISLKQSLNDFMSENREASPEIIHQLREDFISTIEIVKESFGKNAFKNYSGKQFSNKIHPAIYDAVMIGTYYARNELGDLVKFDEPTHISILKYDEFKEAISNRTTNVDNIIKRVNIVKKYYLREAK